ncbi:transcription factor ILI6-like [Phragmites australis]|uniref:transcription factor ILI6-like n=1 Tax=Phragmites australis TaxID=29695 RepID=UPI002D7A2237|nr:transcription factor ILI6-like [Phragmites australis]
MHLSSLSSSNSFSSVLAFHFVCISNLYHPYHLCLSFPCKTALPHLWQLRRQLQATTLTKMSNRRSRSRQSGLSRITEEQISDLVSKLQDLLPEARLQSNARVPSARVLQETCNHIRSLHREVDDLSERLSELLATSDMSSAQAAIIRSLLM